MLKEKGITALLRFEIFHLIFKMSSLSTKDFFPQVFRHQDVNIGQ